MANLLLSRGEDGEGRWLHGDDIQGDSWMVKMGKRKDR